MAVIPNLGSHDSQGCRDHLLGVPLNNDLLSFSANFDLIFILPRQG
jgi:hypothetical protein